MSESPEGFRDYIITVRAFDLPDFCDCLDVGDLRHAYQAGLKAGKREGMLESANKLEDLSGADRNIGAASRILRQAAETGYE